MASICKRKEIMLLCIMAFNVVTEYWHCNMSLTTKTRQWIKFILAQRIQYWWNFRRQTAKRKDRALY